MATTRNPGLARWGIRAVRRLLVGSSLGVWGATLLVAAVGCGGSDGGGEPPVDPGPDTTPPEAITDLRSSTITSSGITLNWTAPGDDGDTGGAVAEYELRYSTQLLNAQNWQTATRFDTGAPSQPGLTERILVSGLIPSTTYYFAVASIDDADNRSGVSNFFSATTGDVVDVTPPGAVTDLDVGTVGPNSVQLVWTASGDDGANGTAFGYDILELDRPITEDNYTEAGGPPSTPFPAAAGTPESWVVGELDPSTTYYFAIIVWDEAHNRSPISNNVMVTTPAGIR
ncbi:MAG: fibronectin type III domain-containing protein [Candidatus Eisenbacteria bacterium]